MREKLTALLLAVLLTVAIIPTLAVAHAQNETNATSTTNTTTTETNTTIPVEPGTGGEFPTQLPVFPSEPESGLQGNETTGAPSNQTESKDNATKVIGLLDDVQLKIDEARQLLMSLQQQLEEARQQQPGGGAATNDTDQIIQDANDTAEDIQDIVEGNLTDSEVISDVGNITEDIEQAINDTIESAPNATVDNMENLTDEAIEVIDNATENMDNSTIEVALDNGMIRLLTNLVASQDYNSGLSTEERDELKANLQDAIAELASNAADALG